MEFARPPRPHPAPGHLCSYLQSAATPWASRKIRFARKGTQPASSSGKPGGCRLSIHPRSAHTRASDSWEAPRRTWTQRAALPRRGGACADQLVGRAPEPIQVDAPLGHAPSLPAARSPGLTSPGCWGWCCSLPRLRVGTALFWTRILWRMWSLSLRMGSLRFLPYHRLGRLILLGPLPLVTISGHKPTFFIAPAPYLLPESIGK